MASLRCTLSLLKLWIAGARVRNGRQDRPTYRSPLLLKIHVITLSGILNLDFALHVQDFHSLAPLKCLELNGNRGRVESVRCQSEVDKNLLAVDKLLGDHTSGTEHG